VTTPAAQGPAPSDDTEDTCSKLRANHADAPPALTFLKGRYARAIEQGDDKHAEIIRQLLDKLLNGEAAR